MATTITPLPTPPTREDPANFTTRADDFLGALPTFQSETNLVAGEVNTNASNASTAASTATAQAGVATTQAGIATTKAQEAAASAASALSAPGTNSTSTTSLTISTGVKNLIIQTGKAYVVGMSLIIASTASPGNRMGGLIQSYNSTSGDLSILVESTTGTGTFSAWAVSVGGMSLPVANQAEMEAGTEPQLRAMSPVLVKQAIVTGTKIIAVTRTSNTAISVGNKRNLIDITSGTFTQTFDAAATLGDGWFCYITNSGTGDITLDPNGAETIDSLVSYVMYPGETRLVLCDGTSLRTVVLNSFYRVFTSSGSFVKPPGYSSFQGLLWGGGGQGSPAVAGGPGVAATNGCGGGGGACLPFTLGQSSIASTSTVTIAAGGTTSNSSGGNSTFAGLTSYGGFSGNFSHGGNGGGILSAATDTLPGKPYSPGTTTELANTGFGGAWGSGNYGTAAGASAYGGGGGSYENFAGGASVYGGGGGGGTVPGTSIFGGQGGARGVNGTAPGGGGGAGGGGGVGGGSGIVPGNGARGELRIWGVI